jgi:hypothetical protein
VTSASRPNLRVRAQRAANHYLYAPSQESLEVGARLPGNHGVVSPVTSTRRSTSLSSVSSPRATSRKAGHCPCRGGRPPAGSRRDAL